MIKKAFFNGLADLITLVTGLGASIILTRALGPHEWGIYSQILWFISLLTTLLGFGLTYTTMRYFAVVAPSASRQQLKNLLTGLFAIQLGLGTLGAYLLFRFPAAILSAIGWRLDPLFIQIAAVTILAATLVQVSVSVLRGLQRFGSLSVVAACSACLSFLCALLTLLHPHALTLLWLTAITQTITIPFILAVVFHNIRSLDRAVVNQTESPLRWREIFKYTSLVYLTSIADQIIWQRSEIFFLAHLSDPSESGYYSLAYTIAILGVTTIPTAIAGVLTPMFASIRHHSFSSVEIATVYCKAFSYISYIVLPSMIGMIIISDPLITALYGDQYRAVIPVLQILAVSAAIGVMARPSASIIHAVNKPQILLFGTLTAIPVNLFLAWILVPYLGAQGAAIANLSAQSINAGIAMIYTLIAVKLNYDWHTFRNISISALLCGIVAYITIHLGPVSLVSLTFAVFSSVVVYFITMTFLRDKMTLDLVNQIGRNIGVKL